MCDFDRKGFAAVDEFFGDSGEVTQSATEQVVPKSLTRPHIKTEPLWRQQQKRKRGNYDDDQVEVGLDGNQEDDEEEAGRTAISAVENKISLPRPVEAVVSKKKKKLGKKERAKLSASSDDMEISRGALSNMQQPAPSAEAKTKGNKRQKRKKVRSRQKNIRKDNRDVVPSHVKLRPLTPETRQKRNGVVVDTNNSPFSVSKES